MSRTSTIPSSHEGKADLYETMLQHSNEPRWFVLGPGLVSPTQAMPDRETLITDAMLIPTYTPTRDAKGHAVMGEPRYLTREEAERWIDAAYPHMETTNV